MEVLWHFEGVDVLLKLCFEDLSRVTFCRNSIGTGFAYKLSFLVLRRYLGFLDSFRLAPNVVCGSRGEGSPGRLLVLGIGFCIVHQRREKCVGEIKKNGICEKSHTPTH